MRSSLEIAQEATLRPITDVAEEAGIEPDELELYGRVQGEGRPLDPRAARRPAGREDRQRHGDHADAGRGRQDDDGRRAHAGARPAGPPAGARAPRGVARARLRDQGRSRRRRLHAGRADGGPEPPLHGRPARHHGRQQPARCVDRRPSTARQRAPHRSAHDLVAPLHGHERPRAARHRHLARRPRERLPAPDGLRHHRGERDHGARRRLPRPPRHARAARAHHGRPDVRGRAGHRRPAEGRRLDDRAPQGRDQA